MHKTNVTVIDDKFMHQLHNFINRCIVNKRNIINAGDKDQKMQKNLHKICFYSFYLGRSNL